MKYATQILTASALALMIQAHPAQADDHAGGTQISLTVSDINAQQGVIRVGVYDSEAGWNDNNAVTGALIEVTGPEMTVQISGLEPGTYGLKLYHDVDGDGSLNTNMMGIPTEPFAFSNNARGRFGPASWDDAHFQVEAGENGHAVSIR